MKARLECVPCIFRQALNTLEVIPKGKEKALEVLKLVAKYFRQADLNRTPANLSQIPYRAVEEVTGVIDPFRVRKKRSNREALLFLGRMRKFVRRASDPLFAAVKVALAGNVIDLGLGIPYDLNHELTELKTRRLAINDYAEFQRRLKKTRRILYIGDNAGEIVFDRVLVEELKRTGSYEITFVVKSGPIINDALMADARAAGLAELVPVIETGNRCIGVDLATVSPEMKRAFREADLIISKGQGNFESLNGTDKRIFFILKAKCDCVADELGVELGDWIFLQGGSRGG